MGDGRRHIFPPLLRSASAENQLPREISSPLDPSVFVRAFQAGLQIPSARDQEYYRRFPRVRQQRKQYLHPRLIGVV